MTLVYKIMTAEEWQAAVGKGRFEGSAIDLADGYIHLSTAAQAQETAFKHFHGQADLVLVTLDVDALSPIKWEPSRGGALFPHLYGPLDTTLALGVKALPLGSDGAPETGL